LKVPHFPLATSYADVVEALDALLNEWRPRVQAGVLDDSTRQAAPAQFAAELQGTRWGLFSLNLSRWLLARAWTSERNNRGNRQGAAALGNWLPTLLKDEGTDLQLKRYQQQPEDLAEQLPRLERLLTWLHLARNVLDVPEVDRLDGVLCKLSELPQRQISPELLDERMSQAQTVQSLKSWKVLVK